MVKMIDTNESLMVTIMNYMQWNADYGSAAQTIETPNFSEDDEDGPLFDEY